jgi:uncharacterized protein (TIGR02284 family)
MSTDRDVTTDLMEVLQDGEDGFSHAADLLTDTDRADLAVTFRRFSTQRAEYYAELEHLAANYGDDLDEDGSARAAIHRTWMTARDTLSGSSPEGILDAAEQGEDHAVKAFEDALRQEISADLRTTVQRQMAGVQAGHDEVRDLRNANTR